MADDLKKILLSVVLRQNQNLTTSPTNAFNLNNPAVQNYLTQKLKGILPNASGSITENELMTAWLLANSGAGSGTVTSVDLSSNGTALTISGNPITTSGTIAVDFNGAITDYVDGTGALQVFPTIPTVTPAALTKVDDTNVTLTLGGTPATALLQATSITVGWSGQLSVARGGTGLSALGTANQLIRVNAGATALEYFTPTYLTGLTVGTTPIASGAVGKILYEGAGNVLQENSNFTFDVATGSQIIGGATARGTRLTAINAADTLASKTIVVRNAADSADRFSVNGNGSWSLTASTGNSMHAFDSGFAGSGYYIGTSSTVSAGNSYLQILPNTLNFMPSGATPAATTAFKMQFSTNFLEINNYGNGLRITHGAWTGSWQLYALSGNFGITTGSLGTGTNRGVLFIENGTAPTANLTNIMQIYSQNITNASFHVRDSNDRVFYAGENVGMRSNHDLKLAANNTVYVTVSTAGLVTLADASNIAVGTTTGTKIGTATTQKLSFWNKTPIVQPTTSITAATFTANTSGIADDTATFGGYTIGQIAAALINTGILA